MTGRPKKTPSLGRSATAKWRSNLRLCRGLHFRASAGFLRQQTGLGRAWKPCEPSSAAEAASNTR
jgi:hypothetical protein